MNAPGPPRRTLPPLDATARRPSRRGSPSTRCARSRCAPDSPSSASSSASSPSSSWRRCSPACGTPSRTCSGTSARRTSSRSTCPAIRTRRRRRRKPGASRSSPAFAPEIERLGDAVDTVGVQMIVPPVISGRALTARAGSNEIDTVLVEGASPNNFEITGAEFAAGRPFTDIEDRAAAPVAIDRRQPRESAVRGGRARAHRRPGRRARRRHLLHRRGTRPAKGRLLRREPQRQRDVAPAGHGRSAGFRRPRTRCCTSSRNRDAAKTRACRPRSILRQLRTLGPHAGERLPAVHVGPDHRELRSGERGDRRRHRRPRRHQPVHRRHRHRQRDADQRDRTDPRDRRPARDWRPPAAKCCGSSCSRPSCCRRSAVARGWRSPSSSGC